jgi:hypothetical protein
MFFSGLDFNSKSAICAIARRQNLTLTTGNVKDFQRPGVRVFDPFAEIDVT